MFTLVLSTSAHVNTKPLPPPPPTRINLCIVLSQVLTRYLQEIEDLEVRLQLATEAEMFDIGIDVSFFLMAWTILLVTEDDCWASCTLTKNAVCCAHHILFTVAILYVKVLRQLKDGERLGGYINQIPPVPMARHREYREKIESLLRNSVSRVL